MRPVYQALKQGSLDSKIEEIFQSSAEDETAAANREDEKEAVTSANQRYNEVVVEESNNSANALRICKHCGWKIDD